MCIVHIFIWKVKLLDIKETYLFIGHNDTLERKG